MQATSLPTASINANEVTILINGESPRNKLV